MCWGERMKVGIIGLGEIGSSVMHAIRKAGLEDELFGVDISGDVLKARKKEGFDVGDEFKTACDVYIVSVWTTDQVISVIKNLDLTNNPLVIIESTIIPGTVKKLMDDMPYLNLAVCPHRLFIDDPTKHVFNLDRVIGACDKAVLKKAKGFYCRYMPAKLLHEVSIQTAELCKPLENSIRYVEIALAEEIRMLCMEHGYDFEEVRDAVNTKWNINLKEAKEGIGRHCLPKDIKIINDVFKFNYFFNLSQKIDDIYKGVLKECKKKR